MGLNTYVLVTCVTHHHAGWWLVWFLLHAGGRVMALEVTLLVQPQRM
jgi:hypothetical protein